VFFFRSLPVVCLLAGCRALVVDKAQSKTDALLIYGKLIKQEKFLNLSSRGTITCRLEMRLGLLLLCLGFALGLYDENVQSSVLATGSFNDPIWENYSPDHVTGEAIRRILFPKLDIGRNRASAQFPDASNANLNGTMSTSRQLQVEHPGYKGRPIPSTAVLASTVCVSCASLVHCEVLNGLLVEEKYDANNPSLQVTCKVLDTLADRIIPEIFGPTRTFRDTPSCRIFVLQYLCLFWGSDNRMYSNKCIHKEQTTAQLPSSHVLAPRPPCRSFCIQVAEVCANDPQFLQLCYDIECPPTADDCTPDPKLNGQTLAAGIGCLVPFPENPYNTAARGGGASYAGVAMAIFVLGYTLIYHQVL
jgi:hypothetical protein